VKYRVLLLLIGLYIPYLFTAINSLEYK